MNANEQLDVPNASDSLDASASTTWRDYDEHQSHRREDLIAQRRRCFLFVSVFPFLISSIALFAMLAFNTGGEASPSSAIDSGAVSLRGNTNGKESDNIHLGTSYLADTGGANETMLADEVSTTTSATVFVSTTTETSASDVIDSVSTTTPETTTSSAETEVASTTVLEETTSIAAATTPQPESTSVAITTAAPVTTTAQAQPTSAPTTTTVSETAEPTTCEEVTDHSQCKAFSSDCVWFNPINYQELCFTKPSFPLKQCKEVRLMDDCLTSAVGCIWVLEKIPNAKDKVVGPKKDEGDEICRFMKESQLRATKGAKHFW